MREFTATGTDAGRIRGADARDLDRVAALCIALSEHHASADPLFSLRPDAEAEIGRLLAAILCDPEAAIFVCERDGELLGFCTVRIDRAPPIQREVRRAEIADLMVRAHERRRGIGRGLVECALAWVRERGVERCEVRVASLNAEGQQFWRSLGFGDLMDVLQRRL
ncbi:MAG: GNAT family N-acetyltransferase [Deltaproteobacteria bacterium]|nr:GNAT family N-acetyltransferase [Deltaproteobacteria bacterium]